MENLSIYESIAQRTQGNIYIGVVGPVRTGKSTFIKRFMDLLVIPNVENMYMKERVKDEMPQSGAGKTIMTTEPKFVPADAVELQFEDESKFKVRLIDCVGYMVEGAIGHSEDGQPRMVSTPWFEEPIPFEDAAETGTRKVIADHSTIGLVITTDGSISEIERENYEEPEARVINELKELNKPFVVIMNSIFPDSERAQQCKKEIEERYQVPVAAINCARMNIETLNNVLEDALFEFPVSEVSFKLPGFIDGLEKDHWMKRGIVEMIGHWGNHFETISDIKDTVEYLCDGEIVERSQVLGVDLGSGKVEIQMEIVDGLFYKVLGEIMDEDIQGDYQFFELIKEMSRDKKAYDKIKSAIEQVEETGYGIVQPKLTEMVLEEPEVYKQGNKFGVRLKAKAPSLHIIKTDITTEVAPIVGSQKQSEDLIQYLLEEFESDPAKIWETNIFGKSLYEMVTEQMQNKLTNVPENIRFKVQKSLQKISDEGKEYFICIVI